MPIFITVLGIFLSLFSSNSLTRVVDKTLGIVNLKPKVKPSKMEVFDQIGQRKDEILKGILQLDVKETKESLSVEARIARGTFKHELQELTIREENSWRQKPQFQWLKHGDANTSSSIIMQKEEKPRN